MARSADDVRHAKQAKKRHLRATRRWRRLSHSLTEAERRVAMKRLVTASIALASLAVLAWWLAAPAVGLVESQLGLGVPSFAGRDYSTHNKMGSSICGDFVTLSRGGENFGDLDNASGSFFSPVVLPAGVTVSRFSLFVNDADLDTDVHAYLVKKKIANNLSPPSNGYKVMAEVHSEGSVVNTMRRFSDDTITVPVIDTDSFYYFVELVDCGIPEPYAVQIVYTTS
jgi:hypothetical protein